MWQINDKIGPVPRGPVFIFTVSLGKNGYRFIIKGKENAFCLSHWANDCSLADPAQRHCTLGFLQPSLQKRSHQGKATMKKMGPSKRQWGHSWANLLQWYSLYYIRYLFSHSPLTWTCKKRKYTCLGLVFYSLL